MIVGVIPQNQNHASIAAAKAGDARIATILASSPAQSSNDEPALLGRWHHFERKLFTLILLCGALVFFAVRVVSVGFHALLFKAKSRAWTN